ncbi:MAG: hypothetical protein EBU90_16015 [Proteobacteria bacterium]|nr:hypothetical protein [Pseudomonadota bacterium]NBP15238.1 hypothetical protein [bacterium]
MPTWRGTVDSNWGTAGNWLTDASGSGVPTANTDATFDASSPNCIVNIASPVCRSLICTGYTNTLTMNNTNLLVVGATTAPLGFSFILSSTMTIAGSGGVATRGGQNGTITMNGKTWPNSFSFHGVDLSSNNSTLTLTGPVVIGSNCGIGPGTFAITTFSGGQTISVGGNLTFNYNGSTNATGVSNSANTTIIFNGTGNSTWSYIGGATPGISGNGTPYSMTLSININMGVGGVLTIANNTNITGYGNSFVHTSGTVITQGTFFFVSVGSYFSSLDLKGSSSPTATTTNTDGVNFNNLTFRCTVNPPGTASPMISDICVVGNFTFSPTTSNNGIRIGSSTGKIIYINGSSFLLNNGILAGNTTTNRLTFQLQTPLSNSSSITYEYTGSFTLASPIFPSYSNINLIINTPATVIVKNLSATRGGYIILGSFSNLTYTAGTLNYQSNVLGTDMGGLMLPSTSGSTITGLANSGVKVENLLLNGAGATSSGYVTYNGSSTLNVGTVYFYNATLNLSFGFIGSQNISFDYLTLIRSSTVGSTLAFGNTGAIYTVKLGLKINNNNSAGAFTIVTTTIGGVRAIFTLSPGASQDIYGTSSRDMDSSAGQTIWIRRGTLSSTINWDTWTYPKTIYQTFITE